MKAHSVGHEAAGSPELEPALEASRHRIRAGIRSAFGHFSDMTGLADNVRSRG
jgi:hypothetical protein